MKSCKFLHIKAAFCSTMCILKKHLYLRAKRRDVLLMKDRKEARSIMNLSIISPPMRAGLRDLQIILACEVVLAKITVCCTL